MNCRLSSLCPRPGARISTGLLLFFGSIVLFNLLLALMLWNPRRPAGPARPPLLIYCAASLLPPLEAVARAYEKDFGVPVEIQPGPSQTLLANLEVTRRGDLYLPADDSYLTLAREKGLVAETFQLARMTAVLAVRQGNPKNIRSLDDLLRDDVRVAQANPEAAAIGKLTRAALLKLGRWEELKQRTRVFKTTVNEVANDLKLGAVDAGFIWDAMRRQYPDLDLVPIYALTNVHAQVAVGVLRSSGQPAEAARFARHLAARDAGLKLFRQFGYEVIQGGAHPGPASVMRPWVRSGVAVTTLCATKAARRSGWSGFNIKGRRRQRCGSTPGRRAGDIQTKE